MNHPPQLVLMLLLAVGSCRAQPAAPWNAEGAAVVAKLSVRPVGVPSLDARVEVLPRFRSSPARGCTETLESDECVAQLRERGRGHPEERRSITCRDDRVASALLGLMNELREAAERKKAVGSGEAAKKVRNLLRLQDGVKLVERDD